MALLVAAAAQLAVGLAVRNVVDGDLSAGDNSLLLALVAVGVVFAAATYCRENLVSWLGERVAADARTKVFSHVVGLSPSFFDRTKTNEVLSRLVADTSVLQTLVVSTAPSGLQSLVLLLGSAALMVVTSPKLAAVALAAVPVLVLPAFALGKHVRRLSRASQDEIAEVNSVAGESLSAITTVQAFNHEAIDRQRVAERVEAAFGAARRRFRAEALLSTTTVMLIFALIAVVLWTGARDLGSGRMTAGEMTAFLIYALLAATSFGSLTAFWAQLQRAAGAGERLKALLDEVPEIVPPAEPVSLPDDARGRISFRNVTFHYPTRPETPALKEFTLEVEPGQTVALVGPSGGGKSTVFNLLLRFYDPQQGQVLLDGVDLRALHPRTVRGRMGLVSQDPAIFNATVAENIRYGRPDATDDEVWEAAEAAAVTEFAGSLPQGFATPLGERGLRLSGGQRQRLAIARALLRDPAGILLLDEATSALDSASERTIQQAIEAATSNRTSLVIAHRLATVRMADRILVLDRGRIVGDGTHDQLMRDNGLYAELARLQFVEPDAAGKPPVKVLRWPAERPAPILPDFASPWEESGPGSAALPGWERDIEAAAERPGTE